jgi:drug/metabolite transporter (DMT)-like permease
MAGSMGLFALEDAVVKRAAAELPVGQILLMLGAAGFLVLAAIARARGEAIVSRRLAAPAVLTRNLAEFVGTIGYVTALSLIPISTASVILQASPLVVTMGAALFLAERVGWRRWSAIFVGLAGVVVILRPGMAGFDTNALWAVLGVIGLSLRDLATRRVPPDVTTLQLSAWAFAAVALSGLLLSLGPGAPMVMPAPQRLAELALGLCFGLVAYGALTAAVRMGDLSVVAPFRFTRMVFALAIGVLLFGESPDAPMLVGAALIVGSGLYTIVREARLRRKRGPFPAAAPPL